MNVQLQSCNVTLWFDHLSLWPTRPTCEQNSEIQHQEESRSQETTLIILFYFSTKSV